MRIRATDGTREVEVEAEDATLEGLEAVALRLLQAAALPGKDDRLPFGFARQLDGVSLDSQTERADE